MPKSRYVLLALAMIPNGASIAAARAGEIEPGPSFRWAGFYIGANGGFVNGEVSTSLSIVDNTPNNYFFAQAIAGVNASGSSELSSDAFAGGGQIGYNFQSGRLIWGLELDFNSTRLKTSYGNPAPGANNFSYTTNGAPYQLVESASMSWLVTARPRVGWAVDDRTIIYATGGAALTRLEFTQLFGEAPFTPTPETASIAKTKVGWTVGSGFEVALTKHWTVKGEYLFTHFNTETAVGVLANANGASALLGFVDGATFNNTVKLDLHTLRAGINYKF